MGRRSAYEQTGRELVYVGKIVRARGVGGELEMAPLGEAVLKLGEGTELLLERDEGEEPREFHVSGVRRLGSRVGLRLEGVDTPESARPLVGHSAMIEAAALPELPDGRYYHYQIVGLEVVDEDGESLGEIVQVIETGGNDVYVVGEGRGEILLPATDKVIVEIDLAAGRMVVAVPPGLIE